MCVTSAHNWSWMPKVIFCSTFQPPPLSLLLPQTQSCPSLALLTNNVVPSCSCCAEMLATGPVCSCMSPFDIHQSQFCFTSGLA